MGVHSFKIKSIHVHKYHGTIKTELGLQIPEEKMSDGINIIYGPNGAGKTTLANAILSLTWPKSEKHSKALVDACCEIDHLRWNIHVSSGTHTIKCVNKENKSLELPPVDWEMHYYLSLHELLTVDDKKLVRTIKNEIHGGIDLEEAKKILKFDEKPASHKNKEVIHFQRAELVVKKITSEHLALQNEEFALELKLKQLAKAEKMKLNRDKLIRSIAYRKAANEKSFLERKLKDYNPILSQISCNDIEKIEEYENKIEQNTLNLTKLQHTVENLVSEQEKLGLIHPPEELSIHTLNENLKILYDLDIKIRDAEQQLAGLRAKEELSRYEICDEISLEEALKLDHEGIKLLKEWQKLIFPYCAEKEICVLLNELSSKIENPDSTVILSSEQLIQQLMKWLGKPDPLVSRFFMPATLIPLLFATSFQIYSTFITSDFLNMIQTGALCSTTFAILYLARLNYKEKKEKDRIKENVKTEHPHLFTRDQVFEELRRNIDQKQTQLFIEKLSTYINYHQDNRLKNIRKIEIHLDQIEQEFISKIPLKPERHLSTLAALTEKICAWKECYLNLIEFENKHKQLQNQFQAILNTCNEIYHAFIPYSAKTYAEAVSLQIDLLNKMNRWKEGKQQIDQHEYKIKHYKNELHLTHNEMVTFYQHRECYLSDLENHVAIETAKKNLLQLIAQKQEYDEIRKRYQTVLDELEKVDGDLDLGTDLILMENELNTIGNIEKELQDLREAITITRTKIETAKEKHDLADALSQKAQALEELQKLYETTLKGMIGSKLVRDLVEKSTRHASKVLNRARELFGEITHHRYELLIGENQETEFLARDTILDHIYSLYELSSGTRIQLLLSVRLAFIEVQEGFHPQMPLLLDEVLGNSDDERTVAIIDAVATLAKRGRQIFYFTAQSDEVERWIMFLNRQKEIQFSSPITLPAGNDQLSISIKNTHFQCPKIPAPNGLTHGEYGALLNVPLFKGKAIDQLHLWYVINDGDILFHLLNLGYTYWGQIQSLIKNHGKEALVRLIPKNEPYMISRMVTLAHIYEKGSELTKIGQSIPIDESILINSGCISESYLQQVIELNKESSGNPKLLIQKLEEKAIQRYRKDKIDDLKNYFINNQIMNTGIPLSREEISEELDAFVARNNYFQDGLLTPEMLRVAKHYILDMTPLPNMEESLLSSLP